MTVTNRSNRAMRNAMATLLAASMLAGCAASGGSGRLASADKNAAQAQKALRKGEITKAVTWAEAAVTAAPRNAALRTQLAQTYLQAGRFKSAVTTFDDAMELGDNSPRNALSLALALVGADQPAEAVALLEEWKDSIPAADQGLALALAGEPGRGVALLSDALRGGENTPKLRQNLAYAYALDGRWKEARLMASQDVAPDQLDARITEWATSAAPDGRRQRVATLLGVPLRDDAGQPQALALANTPDNVQLAVEGAVSAPVAEPVAQMAELALTPAPALQPAQPLAMVAVAPAPDAATSGDIAEFATVLPPVEAMPAVAPATLAFSPAAPLFAAPKAPRLAAATPRQADGSHLVQLGSFASAEGARRAWGIYTARNPSLKAYTMTIIPVVVKGINYWRVAASGFTPVDAKTMCGALKRKGGGCLAYATPRAFAPVPGRRNAGAVQRARRR